MKKKLFATAIITLVLCSLSVNAQQPSYNNLQLQETSVARPGSGYRVHKHDATEMYSPKCGPEACLQGIELTAAQKSKIEKLNKESRDKQRKQREKSAKEHKKYREKMDKEMKKILTPEQYSRYKANKDNMKQHKINHKGSSCSKHNKGNRHDHKCKKSKKNNNTKCCNKNTCSNRNNKQGKTTTHS